MLEFIVIWVLLPISVLLLVAMIVTVVETAIYRRQDYKRTALVFMLLNRMIFGRWEG